MGKVLPQGQPGLGGVGMAAIIRHFRARVRERDCLEFQERQHVGWSCLIFGDLLPKINSTDTKNFLELVIPGLARSQDACRREIAKNRGLTPVLGN
jgi:hypothetical protein